MFIIKGEIKTWILNSAEISNSGFYEMNLKKARYKYTQK